MEEKYIRIIKKAIANRVGNYQPNLLGVQEVWVVNKTLACVVNKTCKLPDFVIFCSLLRKKTTTSFVIFRRNRYKTKTLKTFSEVTVFILLLPLFFFFNV
jgi:hypothetical protein